MFNNKKGTEMPMNTIIIAIIAVVVLVIIIVFFVGGTSSIGQRISEIFSGATAGTDVQTAKQFCQEYCDQDRDTAYCKKIFKVDHDADPKTPPKMWECGSDSTATYAFKDDPVKDAEDDLGLSCPTLTTKCKLNNQI